MNENAKRKIVKASLTTPIGTLLLVAEGEGLIAILFEGSEMHPAGLQEAVPDPNLHVLKQAIDQLNQYFQGERKIFDLPLLSTGTIFQQMVWQETAKIPYGETRSYKEIATALGTSNKARAVGQALNRNHLPIVIPCHRVIGSNGQLTGFAGGLDIKRYLLHLEANS